MSAPPLPWNGETPFGFFSTKFCARKPPVHLTSAFWGGGIAPNRTQLLERARARRTMHANSYFLLTFTIRPQYQPYQLPCLTRYRARPKGQSHQLPDGVSIDPPRLLAYRRVDAPTKFQAFQSFQYLQTHLRGRVYPSYPLPDTTAYQSFRSLGVTRPLSTASKASRNL